ncbi:MAG: phospholipid carrier-dependent glycosyltransferase [Anaerolineae bacterium]|nr:phospholipid carrier-dependent glycosyltransferase [Anaerolineae bacterium]
MAPPLLLLAALLLYLWTWTETAAVSLHVADGRCVASLYGRSSAIDCPGLAGGRLSTAAVLDPDAPTAWLRRWVGADNWSRLRLTATGAPAPAAPLPPAFDVDATLFPPRVAAGIVLLRPDDRTGWVFIVDVPNRRGAWWQWDDGPTVPLRGIPLDRPASQALKPLLRQVLAGIVPAAVLAAVASRVVGQWGSRSVVRPQRSQKTSEVFKVGGRRSAVAATAAVLLAFALAAHVAVDVLERVPHVQDSVTYLFQAQTLARGRLYAPAPPLAATDAGAAFAQEFLLVRDGRWFGKYPPGYPAVLAVGVRAGAPWLVNPLLAALTVALVYALARRLGGSAYPAWSAALAALLLATSPFFVVMSGSLMAHPAELLWTALFMCAWTAALARGASWRPAAVAGAALGALFLTRQFTAATVGLAFGGGWLLVALWSGGRAARADQRRVAWTVVVAALAALPFVVALPAYQAAVTGDPRADPRLLYWPYDRVGFGPGVGEPENAFTMTPAPSSSPTAAALTWYTDPTQPPRGHSPARGLYNLGRNLDALQGDLFGWPAALAFVFLWLLFLRRRATAAEWALLLTALAAGVGYVAYWASGIAYGPRYFYAALPALVILSARGVAALLADRRRPTADRGVPARTRLTVLLLLALVAYNLVSLPGRLAGFRGYNFVSAAPLATVAAAVETPALVFVAAGTADWWEYGAFFSGNTPWLDGPVVYARDLGPAENAALRAAFPERRAYRWTGEALWPVQP